ncbi:MAG TPA: thiamine phosphate synthase [Candidatus Acidoferrales bacterium]|nr:thiamine phosphate synthase [Candidatus Acidoferrales bacterium]
MPTASEPIVCYVTHQKSLGGDDLARSVLAKIEMAIAAGVSWVQIREKDLPGRELFELARAAVGVAAGRSALVFVNDRLDVALAAGAAGVHLGGESLDARDVVRWRRGGNAPVGFRVGVSCHSVEEVREAERAGADYAFFGPIFDTPAKRKFGAPQGTAKLAEACAAVRMPVIAIGGVDASSGAECVRAGAAGVAAIRMFQEANSAAELAAVLGRLRSASGKI